MPEPRIGFIGIGAMGGGMSLRLRQAGYDVTVCDPNPDVLAPLRDAGAAVAATPRAVADAAEWVFACLPAPEISLEVALGEDGVIHGGAVALFVETSTIGRVTATQLAEGLAARDITVVDAPVSGGSDGAHAGTLSTIVAAPQAAFERVGPALSAYASEIFHIGETPGEAQTAKLINNMLSSAAKVATFEGIAMALAAGMDVGKLVDFINVSTGRNMATLEVFPDRLLRLFRSKTPKTIGIKDLELFLSEADALGVPVEVARKMLEVQLADGSYGFNARSDERIAGIIDALNALDHARRGAS